jgi:hypothetical protein
VARAIVPFGESAVEASPSPLSQISGDAAQRWHRLERPNLLMEMTNHQQYKRETVRVAEVCR